MLEDPDEYLAENIFWVPPEARWPHLKAQARQPTIGQIVDAAMATVEQANPALTGVLPKDYARPALDKQRLGQLIDQISNIKVGGRRIPIPRPIGPGLRVLPVPVRHCRGQEGRRVLHAPQRGQAARQDAGALPRQSLRPVLRLGGHVRPVGGVHPRPRQRQRQRR